MRNTRFCSVCEQKIPSSFEAYEVHAAEHHPGHFVQGSGANIRLAEKRYFCPLDGKWYAARKWMARTITAHGLTNEQYYITYGREYMPEEWAANSSDPVLGDARNRPECIECGKPAGFDGPKWHYNAFCGFSCSTRWYAKNTDRVARAQATLNERIAVDPTHQLRPNQLAYWTTRGFSEAEARERVAERQRTNTLDAFIRRAGGDVDEGSKRHADRQERWFESLKASGMFSGFSRRAVNLFETISQRLGRSDLKYGSDEHSVRTKTTVYKIDCFDPRQKRAIEFHGDYWHGNPALYGPEDWIAAKTNGYSVAEKWKRDALKLEELKEKGIDVLVVWEMDHKADPEGVLERCISFLTDSVPSSS